MTGKEEKIPKIGFLDRTLRIGTVIFELSQNTVISIKPKKNRFARAVGETNQ